MKRNQYLILCVTGVMLTIASLARADSVTLSTVTVESREGEGELISIVASEPVTPKKTFVLTNPDRVVVDLPHSRAEGLKLPPGYTGRLIRAIRFGQFDGDTSRLVIDLNGTATVTSTTPGTPLVLELKPTTPLPDRGVAAPAPSEKKPLIMIDAGHGGQDPGAIGLHKTHERDVTLNFARALKKALVASGRYRAELTRDKDIFIMLQDRVNIARKQKSDILISLHADSNPRPEARGLSIYTLSATASDAEAAALAERENKVDIITGLDLNTTDADVASILIDLTQRETMNKSTILADAIVESLHPKINRLPKTHRFAGFRVLKAPDVPSVLVELGFLSNASDEKLLLSPEYRDLVVSSIIKGLNQYYDR